jgi:hypothetical protein
MHGLVNIINLGGPCSKRKYINKTLMFVSIEGSAVVKSPRNNNLSTIYGTGRLTVLLFLVKKIPWWKRKCEMMRCDATVLLSPKFRAKSSHIFTVTVKHHNSMQNSLFGLLGKFFCEPSPWCQRK